MAILTLFKAISNFFQLNRFQNTNLVLTKERSMPKDRTTPFTKSPHSQMADESKPDKLFVDEINEILVNYKENPEKWTVEYIAARYEISKEITGKIGCNFI